MPATVTIPANLLSATFDYTDVGGVDASVTATLGAVTLTSNITVSTVAGAGLVINEVDYDSVGTDTTEFVEIYNGSAAPINLAGFKLVLVNGTNSSVYDTLDLSSAGTINPGQYLVIGSTAALATVAAGALTIDFKNVSVSTTSTTCKTSGTDCVQNGAPDGMALVNTTTGTLIDALSYEGSITSVTITGVGTVSLVEGTALPATVADNSNTVASLCRSPNGSDTNNASVDWKICTTLTPGAANQ
jgi:hypothetical protein